VSAVNIVAWVSVALASTSTLLDLRFPWMRNAGHHVYVFWAIWFASLAVMWVGQHNLPVSIAWGALSGANAWLAYKQRPPRKRRPSKVAARIHDLGHRLVLVPAQGSSR
jgi:membrane protein implicated in regulation of membrane protease activity